MKKLKKNQAGVGLGNATQYLIEEGNWTPVIYAGAPQIADATYWSNGHYQRIRNWVNFSMSIYMTDNGTTGAGFAIGGFPYPFATDYVDGGDFTVSKEFSATVGWTNLPLPTGNYSHIFASSWGQGLNDIDNLMWIGYGNGTYNNQYVNLQSVPNNFYITISGSYRCII